MRIAVDRHLARIPWLKYLESRASIGVSLCKDFAASAHSFFCFFAEAGSCLIAFSNSPPSVSAWSNRQSAFASIVFCSYNSGMPTWDEPKRKANLRKHKLDFAGCEAIFDGLVTITEDAGEAYGELRLNAVGWLHGIVVHMTYTERDDDFHVISLREAEKHEIRRFIKEISG